MKDLGKDAKTAPKSVCYKRVAAMLSDEEKKKTKAQLEFITNVSPVFGGFHSIFQKSCPQVHILYDRVCEILHKLILLDSSRKKPMKTNLEVRSP